MKVAPLVYSKLHDVDYHIVTKPSESFCPDYILNQFILFSRWVLHSDDPLYGRIKTYRWAFYRKDNFILWGAGIRNHLLEAIESKYYDDIEGRTARGFFGIVIDLSKLSRTDTYLPYDIEFINNMFKNKIVPKWYNTEENTEIEYGKELSYNGYVISYTSASTNEELNYDHKKLKFFPHNNSEKLEKLFEEALSQETKQLSFVTGINNKTHAKDSMFMNVSCLDTKKDSTVKRSVITNRKKEETKPTHSRRKASSRYGLEELQKRREIREQQNLEHHNRPPQSFFDKVKNIFGSNDNISKGDIIQNQDAEYEYSNFSGSPEDGGISSHLEHDMQKEEIQESFWEDRTYETNFNTSSDIKESLLRNMLYLEKLIEDEKVSEEDMHELNDNIKKFCKP